MEAFEDPRMYVDGRLRDGIFSYNNGLQFLSTAAEKKFIYPDDPLVELLDNQAAFDAIDSIPMEGVNDMQRRQFQEFLFDFVRRDAWWLSAKNKASSKGLRSVGLDYPVKDAFSYTPWADGKNALVMNYSDEPLDKRQLGNLHILLESFALHAPTVFRTIYRRFLVFEQEAAGRIPGLMFDHRSVFMSIELLKIPESEKEAARLYIDQARKIELNNSSVDSSRNPEDMTVTELVHLYEPIQRSLPLPSRIVAG